MMTEIYPLRRSQRIRNPPHEVAAAKQIPKPTPKPSGISKRKTQPPQRRTTQDSKIEYLESWLREKSDSSTSTSEDSSSVTTTEDEDSPASTFSDDDDNNTAETIDMGSEYVDSGIEDFECDEDEEEIWYRAIACDETPDLMTSIEAAGATTQQIVYDDSDEDTEPVLTRRRATNVPFTVRQRLPSSSTEWSNTSQATTSTPKSGLFVSPRATSISDSATSICLSGSTVMSVNTGTMRRRSRAIFLESDPSRVVDKINDVVSLFENEKGIGKKRMILVITGEALSDVDVIDALWNAEVLGFGRLVEAKDGVEIWVLEPKSEEK